MAPIALLSFIHPWSPSKSDRIQTLLHASLPYYTSPASLCTTFVHATPSTRPKAPGHQLSQHTPASKSLLLAGIEIYADPKALDQQLGTSWMKDYEKAVVDESLYSLPEEMQVWRPVGGFVSREGREVDAEGGRTVMLARFECKDAEGARERVVEVLS